MARDSRVKKTAFQMIYGRTIIVMILLVLQIAMLFYLITLAGKVAAFVMSGLSFVLLIVVINRKGQPSFKMTWVLLLAITPVFGGLFYLFIQTQPGTKQIKEKLAELEKDTRPYMQQDQAVMQNLLSENPQMAQLSHYLCDRGGYPMYQNTSVKYLSTGEIYFEELVNQLKKAEKFIFMEYFIVDQGKMWDTVLEVLKEKAAQGVEVRVMYDGMCSLMRLPYRYPEQVREMGIQCKMFAPIMPLLSTSQNNRDHRKIVVIDGVTAFTGGVNLADEYINEKMRFGHWKDTGIMLQGDAVQNFTMMFLTMWNVDEPQPPTFRPYLTPHILGDEAAGYVVPYADSPLEDENVGEHVYLDILYTSKRYVHIMTPYLIIGHELLQALTYAAKRGVEVELILPHIPDKWYAFQVARTYYRELLEEGVKIYEYTPGFIHAKSYVSDDEKAVVGSINMDFRSLYLHYECAALFFNNPAVADVEKDFQETKAKSQMMTIEDYNQLPLRGRIAGQILRLIAPLM
ncbi:MAG: cardiolipin synthase [Firmicutes bacterium]|nr:cardiolipin synthase [Bacillota bacterium]